MTSHVVSDFLANSVARRPAEQALGYIRGSELTWLTWREVADQAKSLAAVLRATGVLPGDRVAQVSENRFEWIITDLALHLAGAVHVPIHVTLAAEQMAEQIIDCEARVVFVSSQEMLSKFADKLPGGKVFFVHDEQDGVGWKAPLSKPPALSRQPPVPSPQSLATILYTSGTTGRSRGVMLTHGNLASNAAATADSFGDDHPELRLCVLPLSHIYARTCDLYTWLYRGTKLVLAESRETLARDLQIVRPSALNAVPFLYQRIADRVRAGGGNQAQALREFFGGRIEQLNCGGAPLAPETEQWYAAHGLPVLLGYGLTETSPVVAASTPKSNRAGAVGRVLADVDVRIAADGEILVRGPNVMPGYWKDDVATAAAIQEGWFYTGDLGELDADGFLFIRGRKKELIVLSTGKKVAPSRVELLLTASPIIEQAVVFGDNLCGLVALIVPAAEEAVGHLPEVTGQEKRYEKYATEIKRCLASAAHEEQIHRYALLDRPFAIERGEMTGKLSLCRAVIAKNFSAELGKLSAAKSESTQGDESSTAPVL
jgi:long-chain acyl-CoA synthetase